MLARERIYTHQQRQRAERAEAQAKILAEALRELILGVDADPDANFGILNAADKKAREALAAWESET